MDFLFYLLCIVGALMFAIGVLLIGLGNPTLKHSMDEQSERAEREQGPEGF